MKPSRIVRCVFRSLALTLLLWSSSVAVAEGPLNGTLRGRVVDPDGTPLAAVVVSVRSPSLQGARRVRSSSIGHYSMPGLPPGLYGVTFDLAGFTAVERRATIELGRVTRTDAVLEPSVFKETLIVLAQTSPAVETPQVGQNLAFDHLDGMPLSRTLSEVAYLAAGVVDRVPRRDLGQVRIAGGLAWDSLFRLDGADVSETLYGV